MTVNGKRKVFVNPTSVSISPAKLTFEICKIAYSHNLGWISFLGNLSSVAPGMIIGGDVYKNRNGHLPKTEGRVWFESDINYDFVYRNHHRLIYSNDGLIFATYDHYMTFVQIQ